MPIGAILGSCCCYNAAQKAMVHMMVTLVLLRVRLRPATVLEEAQALREAVDLRILELEQLLQLGHLDVQQLPETMMWRWVKIRFTAMHVFS